MKNRAKIQFLILLVSFFAGCNCEGPKETYTIKGRLYSDGIPVQEHRLEFYRKYDSNPLARYEFIGVLKGNIDGNYNFEYATDKFGTDIIMDVIGPSDQLIMKLVFPFREDITQDINISERRQIVLKLKSSIGLSREDTLFFDLYDFFPRIYGEGTKIEYFHVAGPIDTNYNLDAYVLNGQLKSIGYFVKSGNVSGTPRDFEFPLATELNLDTIEINY